MIKVVTTGTVVPLSDGTVPIELSCLVPVPCRGALLLVSASNSPYLEFACGDWGRSDLLVDAHSTRVLGVPLSRCAQRLLHQQGRLAVFVGGDANLIPPCDQIADLAAECRKFESAPGYAPMEGDGLDTLVSGSIVLASSRTSGK